MNQTMASFLTDDFMTKEALPSNLVYGRAIFERGATEFIKREPDEIEGWAGGLAGTMREGGGSRRRVTFTLVDGKLHWNCTGNPKHDQIFCKHCVALAMAVVVSRGDSPAM